MMTKLKTFIWAFLLSGAGAAPALAAYDLPYVGEDETYYSRYEDTFVHVARDYNLGFTEMRAANPYVDPWLPGRGTKLILPTRHLLPDAPREGVVINLADMRLYAYVNGDEAPDTYSIGIGREGLNTPLGSTTVVRKTEGPVWRPTPRMMKEDPKLKPVVLPGPDNPMGTHAMYLGWPQYAIHGTNKPFGIGRRSSSGCIRMYPEGIVDVYNKIPVGTKVTVVDQPVKVAWIDNRLYLEVSPTLEQSVKMEETGEAPEEKLTNEQMKKIIEVAGAYKDRLRWPAIRQAIKERGSYPVEIARRPGSGVSDEDMEEDLSAYETPEEAKDLVEGNDEKPTKIAEADKVEEPEMPKDSEVADAADTEEAVKRLNP